MNICIYQEEEIYSDISCNKKTQIYLQRVEHASPGADHLLRLFLNREGADQCSNLKIGIELKNENVGMEETSSAVFHLESWPSLL